MVCGSHQSIALSADGQVFHWGTVRPISENNKFHGRSQDTELHYRVPQRLQVDANLPGGGDGARFSAIGASDSYIVLQRGTPPAPVRIHPRRASSENEQQNAANSNGPQSIELKVDNSVRCWLNNNLRKKVLIGSLLLLLFIIVVDDVAVVVYYCC